MIRGLRRRIPAIDLVRAQDTAPSGLGDPLLLDQAAAQNRLLLTHDVTTMTRYAYERIQAGLATPGIFAVSDRASIGEVIDDLALVTESSAMTDWASQVIYVPFR